MDIVYYVATSLDGYIADADGGVDWLNQYMDTGEDYGYPVFYASVEGIVMGSHTYEFALKYAPKTEPDRPTWVFTTRDLPVSHSRVTLTSEDPKTVVKSIEDSGLKSVWLMGGGKIAGSFRQDGLISRYMIAVIPIILGDGIPLFDGPRRRDPLKLTDSKVFPTGIVMLTYDS